MFRNLVPKITFVISTCIAVAGCAPAHPGYETVAKCRPVDPGAQELTATWMGVAGFKISDGEVSFLIDPFVSRKGLGLARLASGKLIFSDPMAIARADQRVDAASAEAIIVTHAHYDHVLDVPGFAKLSNARIYGSESAKRTLVGSGVNPNRVEIMEPDRNLFAEIGRFRVTFVETGHARLLFNRVIFDGVTPKKFTAPAPASAYRTGRTFALIIRHEDLSDAIVYIGTGAVDEETFAGKLDDADRVAAYLAITGRGDTSEFLRRTVGATGADIVTPHHFDSLFHEPTPPLRITKLSRLDEFLETLETDFPSAEPVIPPVWRECAVFD